jgi:hypothetical protein
MKSKGKVVNSFTKKGSIPGGDFRSGKLPNQVKGAGGKGSGKVTVGKSTLGK